MPEFHEKTRYEVLAENVLKSQEKPPLCRTVRFGKNPPIDLYMLSALPAAAKRVPPLNKIRAGSSHYVC